MVEQQIKIEQIKQDNAKKRANYKPSKEEQDRLTQFIDLFERDRQTRDNELKRYFGERTLEQYLDDCQKRINGYVEPRKSTDDWRVRYRGLLTRNKMLAILAKAATARMKMKFKDKQGAGDSKKLKVFNALYSHYCDLDNEDMKQFMAMWAAWSDGTVAVMDKPEKKTKKQRQIDTMNDETGEYETTEQVIKKWHLKSTIIPLQNIWFGDIRESSEQDQPHIWLRFTPYYQDFWADWGKFKNAEFVTVGVGDEKNKDTFYSSQVLDTDKVEVLMYMNVWEDRLIIWANTVELYDGPLPYGLKDDPEGKFYPITVGVSEPISPNLIYGKSGADKLKGDQDMLDLFFRKLADRTILTSEPPIFMEGGEDNLPEEIKLNPSKPIPVDSLAGVREFAFANNQVDILRTIKAFQENANLTSVDSASSGYAQSNRTATADSIAENAIRQLVGLFQFFIENFLVRKAKVRAKLILQGIETPESSIGTVVKGKVKNLKLDYGTFSEKNVMLDDGSRGTRVYKIVGAADELKSRPALDMMEAVAKQNGENIQITMLTPDYFDGLLTEVEPVPGSTMEQSAALKKAVESEFLQGFMGFFPELFMQNQLELAKDYLTVYEKEVDRLIQEGQPMMGGQPQQPMPVGVPQAGTNPTANRARNNFGVPQALQNMQRVARV